MGRQGGIARFLGTCGDINGYADDGRAIWRVKSSLDKKKWLKLPSMAGQREAARLFSSASVIAGNLWRRLPAGMRRLADGGGFNTLVGQCRVLVDADGQIGDVDGLRGLDLSADSSGPCRVIKNEELRMKNGGSACANSVYRISFQLTGVRELMDQIDAALGDSAGKRSAKYVVAAGLNPWVVKETVDWEKLGKIEDFRGGGLVSSEQVAVSSSEGGDQGLEGAPSALLRVGSGLGRVGVWQDSAASGVQRRVRVWVHAVELVETECRTGEKYFQMVSGQRRHHSGFVTPWVVQGSDWAADYRIEDGELQLLKAVSKGTGMYVVFTAVEVAEKRGRHWVRLPWCSRMRVSDVVEVSSEQVAVSSEPGVVAGHRDWYMVGSAQPAGSEARLVAVEAQRVEASSDFCLAVKSDFVGYGSHERDCGVVIEYKLGFRHVVSLRDEVLWGVWAGP